MIPTIFDCIAACELTPQNIARLYSAFVLGELANSSTPSLSRLGDKTLKRIIAIQNETLKERPNLKAVRSLTAQVVDSIEMSCNDTEGEAIQRLREFERAIETCKAQGVKSASRGSGE